MSNDADQKIKSELFNARKVRNVAEQMTEVFDELDIKAFIEGARYQHAQALAEIESLRAENAELKFALIDRSEKYKQFMDSGLYECVNKRKELETKLTAATSQMEKMAKVLQKYSGFGYDGVYYVDEALADYEEFKKESK